MYMSQNGLYRFDEFVLNRRKRTLVRDGEPVPLLPKAFEVLSYLVMNSGRVIGKEELLKAVWPESFVEEGNLTQQISGLRKALGDRGSYIVTVPGRGYQFAAEVIEEDLTPAPIELPQGTVLVQTIRERSSVMIEETTTSGRDPQRALPPPGAGKLSWTVVLLGLLLVVTAALFLWNRLHRAAPSVYRIVLADFDNRSGEDVFDFVLKNALEIDLEQSPMLTTLSVVQTRRTLQQMARSPEERLTPAIAREVCERNGSQAVLGGSVVKLASSYVITLEATDCVSGKSLAKLQTQATGKDDTLKALGNIASKMRRKLGESLRSVEGFDVPIDQSTTASFDALVAYSRGLLRPDADAIPFFERAIQLDPNFAMAYEQLGVAYGNLADVPAAKKAFAKAYDLRQPTDAYEQFVITSRYYEIVQDDLDLAAKNYELWTRSYPQNRWVWGTLTNTYTQMGHYPEAIAAGQRGLSVDPNVSFPYVVLSRAYKRASQFDKAEVVCKEAIARKLDSWGVHSILFQIAVYNRDEAAMARETDWDKDKATHNQTLDNAAFAAATMGQLQQAEGLFQQAQEAGIAQETADYPYSIAADRAESERLLGDLDHARANAVKVPVDRDEISFQAAINAALSGDTGYAKRVIDEEKKAPETSTLVKKVQIPLLESAIALHERKPALVPALLEPAKVYELRDYYVFSMLGEAFLEMHRADDAVTEYQKILANPGLDPVSPMYPLGHLGLARAYAMLGKAPESRKEYEAFFALWAKADAGVPVLKQARLEYDRLPR